MPAPQVVEDEAGQWLEHLLSPSDFHTFPKAITVFFKEIQKIFSTTYIEIAWISFIMQIVMYAGGLISSVLVNKYGYQCGGGRGLLYCVGMVAASNNTSVIGLYLTVGFTGDLGLALNWKPALAIIGKCFQKKRHKGTDSPWQGVLFSESTLACCHQFIFKT